MSKKAETPKRVAPPAVGRRSMYISAPESVLKEIDNLLEADPLSRGRFLGRLLELGLAAYKAEKGLPS